MAGWKRPCCSHLCPNLGQNFSILVLSKSCQKGKTIEATNKLDLTASPDMSREESPKDFPLEAETGSQKRDPGNLHWGAVMPQTGSNTWVAVVSLRELRTL